MTAVSTPAHDLVVPRDVTPDELAHLDRLRAALARVVDRTEPRAISWLWDRTVAAGRSGPAPVGFVESVATALGDLLAVHVPTARWSVWPGPDGPTLGVASAARPHAPVVPFADARDRWESGTQGWIVEYLARAAAHLAGAAVPRPRPARDDEAPAAGLAAAAETPADEVPAAGVPAAEASAAEVPIAEAAIGSEGSATDSPPAPADRTEPASRTEPATGTEPPADATAVAETAPPPGAPAAAETSPSAGTPSTAGTVPAATIAGPTSAPADEQTAEPTAGPAFAPAAGPADERTAGPADEPARTADPTPRSVEQPPDEPLERFARDTLDHAVALLREAGAFDHEALVVLIGGDGQRTQACPGEPSESLLHAREFVRDSGARRAAVAWVDRHPGDLPGPPQRFPAVLVDAWDAGAGGLRLAHRFVDDVLGTDPLGEPLDVGPVPPLI